ncbi:MAG: alpha/beta hydrolase [Propioniciclava sp.]
MLNQAHRSADFRRLVYARHEIGGRTFLARDLNGPRIVEALGDLDAAEHIAVMVPGNGHNQRNYLRNADQADSLHARGELLLATMQALAPSRRLAVITWVGYHTPANLAAAWTNGPARTGAPDLARLTQLLPASAQITLVGHSYGTTVCGLALTTSTATDCIALGSPGMGVWRHTQLGGVRLWAAQGDSDWIRWSPHLRVGSIGLGRAALHPELGAIRFRCGDVTGHCNYHRPASESLLNTARIAVGAYGSVSTTVATHLPEDVGTVHSPAMAA